MKRIEKQITYTDKHDDSIVSHKTEEEKWYFYDEARGYVLHHERSKLRLIEYPLPEMTDDQIIKFTRLLRFIKIGNKLLREDRPGYPMTYKQVMEVLKISRSRAYMFLKQMREFGLIRMVDDTYYVNPLYLMIGSRLTKQLYAVWKPELDEFLPEWVKEKLKEE